MRLPKFEYREPKGIQEAVSMLADEPGAKVLAGGTDLLVNMKHRVEQPSLVINLKRIGDLDYIRRDGGAVRIGALTSLKKVYHDSTVAENFPALARAAASVGSYHHQSMGSIGGNICQQNRCMYYNQSKWWRSARPLCFKAGGELCHVVNKKEICYSSYCGDTAPALLVLGAGLILEGPKGSREISLDDLYTGDGKAPLALEKGEILREVVIPEEAMGGSSIYMKFANRESIDFPIVGHALWVSKDGKGYRAAYTGVDRRPVRAKKVSDFLQGKDLSEAVMEEAAALASKEATPVKNSVYAPSFKRRMMGLLLKKAMNEMTGRAE